MAKQIFYNSIDYKKKFNDPNFYVKNSLLTDQFINENKYKLNWKWLTKLHKLTEEQIDKYFKFIVWEYVFLNKQEVSEEFIEKHEDKIENWDWICVKRKMSIPFVYRHMNKWHWTVISQESIIDHDFALEFRDKIDWRAFTLHRWNEWDETFKREFKDYIEWEFAFYDGRYMSNDLRREYAFKFKPTERELFWIAHGVDDENFKEWAKFLDKKDSERLKKNNCFDWNMNLTDETIMNNIEYFDLYRILSRRNLGKKLKREVYFRLYGDKNKPKET